MIIDMHTHIGVDVSGESYSLDELFKDMEESGVTHSVVFPFSRPDADLMSDSVMLLEAARRDKRLIPFMRFNPNTVTEDRLRRLLAMDFKGVKLHPNSQKFFPDDERFFWIYRLIEEKGIPIIFHTKTMSGESSKVQHLVSLAKKFPGLKMIIGHFFGDDFSVVEEARSLPNVYVETSIYSRPHRIKKVLKQGFDRVLLGSDAPYDHQSVAVIKVLKSKLPEEDIDKIMFRNACRLLDIPEN